ncbi:hypothetical protein LTR10_017724 [Elasticomyces elasticus]|uniref:Amidohydrolase-related domain-containing protein n=1 Tax=Exophiala sideris TaxID=1016849 RepID=A0ABR0JBF6_9EURO|nr:hypothetical protein LTR10_017724 [Elasticomyces elasticus]KAK5060632.1 hypothetical protein LTR69_005231 [Exophiala sideris]
MTPPLITLEEHWYSKSVFDSFENDMKTGITKWPGALDRLFDASDLRLKEMDRGKIALQVISHCAADRPSPEVCQAGNDQLADEMSKSEETRSRFAGFAVLPMAHPEAAAEELERTVNKHGFVGALVDNKAGDKFYDGDNYDVLWQKLQDLDVPIYLHPSWPTAELLRTSLKIILGHFGEMIPFMLQRVIDQESIMGRRNRPFEQVWNENIWITTSAAYSLDPMRCILANTKIERIMYSVDYPFTTNEQGLKFFQDLEKSGLVTEEHLELIAFKNAEKLLGVKASPSKQANGGLNRHV